MLSVGTLGLVVTAFLPAVLVAFSISFEQVPDALPMVRAVFEACPVEPEAIEDLVALFFEDVLIV